MIIAGVGGGRVGEVASGREVMAVEGDEGTRGKRGGLAEGVGRVIGGGGIRAGSGDDACDGAGDGAGTVVGTRAEIGAETGSAMAVRAFSETFNLILRDRELSGAPADGCFERRSFTASAAEVVARPESEATKVLEGAG